MGDVDLLACDTSWGAVLHTTVGLGHPGPGSALPKLELVALAERPDGRILGVLEEMIRRVQACDGGVRAYGKLTLTSTPGAVSDRYILLDGGSFGLGWNAKRLLVVPATAGEHDRFDMRDEASDGDRALALLGLGERATVLSRLPAAMLRRW